MENKLVELIKTLTGAETVSRVEVIQRLWSGYGELARYRITGSDRDTVIVKQVKLSAQGRHGARSVYSLSHQRKLHSYQVERYWYGHWSSLCHAECRVPVCLGSEWLGDDLVIVLEDLNASGFPVRRTGVTDVEMHACLQWLANFHATFMGEQACGLWPTGTYWHLETRPDEWRALDDVALKEAAVAIDRKLKASPYQTFVHGDAKLANFCFARTGNRVAAVDFQYVGGGCGIKDVAYFIDSCLDGEMCQQQAQHWLDVYFQALKQSLQRQRKAVDADAVEQDWRALYPVAWTDFHRFLKGWSAGYWPKDSYSERLARQVIAEL